ncbi:MAG: amidohydrolase, partial [Lachnospiraceae bacterium]|nr:amidohydrolase [Lachnospiraceae bacterium]
METNALVKQYTEDMIAIRRHIHANPEISNAEFQTTALIKEKLTEYGVEIAEIGLKTGVIGIIRGGKPGKTIAIREDIDALPMPELTGLPYASTVENVC